MDLPHGARHNSTMRSFNGCWTCRLRRKKCDEKRPVCDTCTALQITCHFGQHKPEWMDGGARQGEMAERLKHEVKEKAYRRRGGRAVEIPGDGISITEVTTDESISLPQRLHRSLMSPKCDRLQQAQDDHHSGMGPCPEAFAQPLQRRADCTLISKNAHESVAFDRSDTILLMFYLEHLLPFLFPFYNPSILEGGRSWILEMMISSPVVRQATLCQSSYFFSLARGTTNRDALWEAVLVQTKDAFGMLRQSLLVIDGSSITEHLHGAVRIMTSIVQLQRFEIAVSSFKNCHAHLNAALALFQQLLNSSGTEPEGPGSNFNAVIDRLGSLSWLSPDRSVQVPSAEQAAFRFSTTLLILDDIIASTVLQEKPRLYEYYGNLLLSVHGAEPLIDFEATVGCQNWALIQIGEISVLDAWKQQSKRDGNLDVMELVRRARAIKNSLEAHLARLETGSTIATEKSSSFLDFFKTDCFQQSRYPRHAQRPFPLATR